MEEEDEKEDGLVMTPGTILLMKDGDNLAALQRQVVSAALLCIKLPFLCLFNITPIFVLLDHIFVIFHI